MYIYIHQHTCRNEAAALLLRLAQQQQQQASGTATTAAAIAVGAGAMDAFFGAKHLQSHPERAVMLAARARALSALAAGMGDRDGTARWLREALSAQAMAAARGALAVYGVAFGVGHVETEVARALVGRVEAEARGL